jgi:hypothetical protein
MTSVTFDRVRGLLAKTFAQVSDAHEAGLVFAEFEDGVALAELLAVAGRRSVKSCF